MTTPQESTAAETKRKPQPLRALADLFSWAAEIVAKYPKIALLVGGFILPPVGTVATSVLTMHMKTDPTVDSVIVARLDKIDSSVSRVTRNQVVLSSNQVTLGEVLSHMHGFTAAENKVRRARAKRAQDSARARELYGPPLWENDALEAIPYEPTVGRNP